MAGEVLRTQCCIAGGGPAGVMLGLLLARQGLDVVVMEKHGDFLRDFRGDTIHPSTMEVLDELGLASSFLALGPNRVPVLRGSTPGGVLTLADFRRLRTPFPFIALIPQWDFLDFLAAEGRRHPGFHLLMETEATDLLEEDGGVRGVRYRSPAGTGEVRTPLTVAADGRHSVLRERSGLPMVHTSPPVDVLWFRLPRAAGDPADSIGSTGGGHVLVLINRGDYWQIGYTVPKGSADRLRAGSTEALQRAVAAAMPALADRVGLLDSWDRVSLLTVQANRLRRWHRPGLLCIGDAAHAMSPVGGVGINAAVQDAVVAANLLAEALRRGRVTDRDLARVQRRRAWQVWIMQVLQAQGTRAALASSRQPAPGRGGRLRALAGRLLDVPGFLALRTRLIGLGIRRAHVRRSLRAPVAGQATSPRMPAG